MKRKFLRMFSAVIAVVLLFSNVPAYADGLPQANEIFPDTQAAPRLKYVEQLSASISNNGGIFVSTADTEVYDNRSFTLKLVLQRSRDDSTWTNYQSWSTSGKGNGILEKEYYGGTGYYYRCAATCTVLTESVTAYSPSIDHTSAWSRNGAISQAQITVYVDENGDTQVSVTME